ncbi:ankyrin repeat-containing protein [Salix suchowensis]|nr:ankyrin repeat-containing protein [Salix suchowensis]
MEAEWNKLVDYYKDHSEHLFNPVTDSSDTVLHLAIQSNKEQPLKKLLEIMKKRELSLTDETEFLKKTNKFGNTALHEATIYGNYEAVKLLVERWPCLVKMENNFGETPLFTAAGFAKTEIVEFLIGSDLKQCMDDDGRLLHTHRKRTEDDLSILSAAIIGQKFETAYLLLELDTSLASLKDTNQISTLQLLAEMPTAFEGGVPMGICERFIYSCLPSPSPYEVKSKAVSLSQERKKRDLESGQGRYSSGDQGCGSEKNQRGGPLNYLKIRKGGLLERIWDEKRKHVFALAFAESLVEKDESLKVLVTKTDQNKDEENEERDMGGEIPLFTAARRGIEKIVRLIIERHPHAIDKCDDMGRSILDVAVIYRQQKIFDIIVNEKEKEVPLARMRRVLDKSGNTLLHHVADIKKNSGVTKPGPALQLQEELKWFEQVEKVIPSHYVPLLNKEGKTARECFEIAHEEKLEKAQLWIKETSQSCSTVAALVSTVVFAAAYTVPGELNYNFSTCFVSYK